MLSSSRSSFRPGGNPGHDETDVSRSSGKAEHWATASAWAHLTWRRCETESTAPLRHTAALRPLSSSSLWWSWAAIPDQIPLLIPTPDQTWIWHTKARHKERRGRLPDLCGSNLHRTEWTAQNLQHYANIFNESKQKHMYIHNGNVHEFFCLVFLHYGKKNKKKNTVELYQYL